MFYQALLLLYLFYTGKVLSDNCYSPDNEEGQCVSLASCPKIVKAFANPKKESEEYLRKFICDSNNGIKVCCTPSINYGNSSKLNSTLSEFKIDASKPLLHDVLSCDPQTDLRKYEFFPPSLAELRVKNLSSNVQFTKCLGSLITPRYVLTAAECITGSNEAPDFTIVAVRFQVGNKTKSYYKWFDIEEQIAHPFYDGATGINNIALLRINSTIPYDDEIRQSCLYKPKELPPMLGVWTATFVNFLKSNKEGILSKLISNKECKESLKGKNKQNDLTDYDMCSTEINYAANITPTIYIGASVFVVLNANALGGISSDFNPETYEIFIKIDQQEVADQTIPDDTSDESKDIKESEESEEPEEPEEPEVPEASEESEEPEAFEEYEETEEPEEFEEDIHDPFLVPLYDLYLVGISSSRTKYGDEIPVVYTNVSLYLDWILENMRPWPIVNEKCKTPTGKLGNCIALNYCPVLMKVFATPKKGSENYLRSFICKEKHFDVYVCCDEDSNPANFHNEGYNSTHNNNTENVTRQFDFFDLHRCGIQHRDDYFSSNDNITIDEYPWIVSILQRHNRVNPLSSAASGSLINARYVLTTANQIGTSKELVVRIGDFNGLNETDCVEEPEIGIDCSIHEDINIEEIITHPFYSFTSQVNNIALLRLQKSVSYTDYIRPICLPIPGIVSASPGETVYLSSWGWNRRYHHTILKKKITNVLITNTECDQKIRQNYESRFINEHSICTVYSQNHSSFACDHDIGGPLMFHNNFQWHIEGILIQFHNYECSQKDILIYTNVSKYFNWIVDNMRPW